MNKKQFTKFKALVPGNFEELMIKFWMENEELKREEALAFYYNKRFINLVKRLKWKIAEFTPDLGYSNREDDGKFCFEIEDNDFVIPVSILIPVNSEE